MPAHHQNLHAENLLSHREESQTGAAQRHVHQHAA